MSLVGMVKGEDGNWTNKNGENVSAVMDNVFDVTFDQVFGWLEEKPVQVKEIIKDVVGNNSLAEVADVFLEVGYANRASGIESVTIGDGVTSIGESAFRDCFGLTSITYTGTVSEWDMMSKGTDWNSNTPDYIVYCTDGTVAKDGTITYN